MAGNTNEVQFIIRTQAEARTRREMSRLLPSTPVESAAWLARLMQEMWKPFVEPSVMKDSLGLYQVGKLLN